MASDDKKIDPVQYGVMLERVQAMDKKIDKMEARVDQLLELANRSKGAFWAGMAISSGVGGVMGWLIDHWRT